MPIENDLPRPDRDPLADRRDWENVQTNSGDDYTERLAIVGGWLYRTVDRRAGVALVFVPDSLRP